MAPTSTSAQLGILRINAARLAYAPTALRSQIAILNRMRLKAARLGYVPAPLYRQRGTAVRIVLNGLEARSRVRLGTLTITDAINDTPNTCAFTIEGTPAPSVAQSLRITINANAPLLLFAGAVQTAETSYEASRPTRVVYKCTGIDDTARADRRLPFGAWTNISATAIAQQIIAGFAPGFSSAFVQPGLPAVSVNLDGSEGMTGAFKQLAKLIGGYFYVEDLAIHLFQSETVATPPDPIDAVHPFLDDPPVALNVDQSQVRTRVYGKGHGEAATGDVLASDTQVPIADVAMFNPAGGQAITLTQRFTYTGIQVGGYGSLVGPGLTPAAPTLALAPGGAVDNGVHGYSVTFVTGSGETIAGQLATVAVGVTPPPATAPTLTLQSGSGIEDGAHGYAVSFVTSAGETLVGLVATVTCYLQVGLVLPVPTMSPCNFGGANYDIGTLQPSTYYYYAVTFGDASGETTLGTGRSSFTSMDPRTYGLLLTEIPIGPTGTTRRRIYRSVNGTTWGLLATLADNTSTTYIDMGTGTGAAPPSSNTTGNPTPQNQVRLSTIPKGDATITQRKIYRTKANATALLLLTTLADNTTTTYTDSTPDASLGAPAPTTASAIANTVNLGLAIGPATTTARKIYRTVATSGTGPIAAPLKLLATIGNNTAASYTDTAADSTLGAGTPPTADTSGLPQPAGDVPGGSPSLPVASSLPFNAAGGWIILGAQTIRYTGISGNTLTGLPPSGPGALINTVRYGEHADVASVLTGVAGLTQTIGKGDPVNIWIQVDDYNIQAAMARLDGGDGIYEYLVTDERRGEASLRELCLADLQRFGAPLQTLTYATRDMKTKSGRTIVANLTTPPIQATLMIQTVQISEIDMASGLPPKYQVTASSVRVSLEDLLRQLAAATDTGGT